MNWDAVGALGEVVGAVAVVATLAYLALQIRQSTSLARATAQREVNTTFQSAIDRMREEPEIFQRGCVDFENLSRKDQLTFDLIVAPMIVNLDQAVRMHDEGLESLDNVETYGGVCLAILQAPGARYWYERVRPFTPAAATNYLDARFADSSKLPPAFVEVLPWHRPDSELTGDGA